MTPQRVEDVVPGSRLLAEADTPQPSAQVGSSPERPPGRPPGQRRQRRRVLMGPPRADGGSPLVVVSARQSAKIPGNCPISGPTRSARPFAQIPPPMRHGICTRCGPTCEARHRRLRSWRTSWGPWQRRRQPGLRKSRTRQIRLNPMRARMIRPSGWPPMQEPARCPTWCPPIAM